MTTDQVCIAGDSGMEKIVVWYTDTHPLAWSCWENHINSKAKQNLEGYLLNSQCCCHRSCVIYFICSSWQQCA